jgi:GNAT superfamily N-acetyltransferase
VPTEVDATVSYRIRTATENDRQSMIGLIARSARALSAGDYSPEQVEGALRGAFGVDTQLVQDGTYFVVEADGMIAGCGGWSYRKTLFGGDAHTERDAAELDPKTEAAKIRAFFVEPAHARKGIGRALLEHCEAAARERGFTACELMATLPGLKLYRACGYVAGTPVRHTLATGLTIDFVPMSKRLS